MNYYSLLLILLTYGSIFSQEVNETYETGHFFDINKFEIGGYYEKGYQADGKLKVEFTVGEDRTHGYYYNTAGNKVKGYMKTRGAGKFVKFSLKNTQEYKRVKASECNGFVIGKDSFAVVQNFFIGKKKIEKKRFAQVIDKVAGVTYYRHIKFGNNQTIVTYLAKKDGSNEYVSFSKKENQFKDDAISFFGKVDFLKKKIIDNEYKAEDIPSLIKQQKYYNAYVNKENIYFNSSWDETKIKEEYKYYAKVESIQDGVFKLSFYFITGVKNFYGEFSSIYPHEKSGFFIWYDKNGIKRKKIKFKDNKPESFDTFYENGELQWEVEFVEEEKIFKKVMTKSGINILDSLGNGKEELQDIVMNRVIYREYKDSKLNSSYYLDELQNPVYQYYLGTKKPFRWQKTIQSNINSSMTYPKKSIRSFSHGYVLARCVIDPNGITTAFDLIKGIDDHCNALVIDILKKEILHQKRWKTLKIDGKKVAQEYILPFDFNINSFSRFKNHYNINNMMWFHHEMFMQQNMMWQQQQMQMNIQRSMPPGF